MKADWVRLLVDQYLAALEISVDLGEVDLESKKSLLATGMHIERSRYYPRRLLNPANSGHARLGGGRLQVLAFTAKL
jgi:hypothetical protein